MILEMTLGDWRTFFSSGRFVRINADRMEYYRDPYDYGRTYQGVLYLRLNYNDPWTAMPMDSPAWQAWNEKIESTSVQQATGTPFVEPAPEPAPLVPAMLPPEQTQQVVVPVVQPAPNNAPDITPYVPEIQEQAIANNLIQNLAPVLDDGEEITPKEFPAWIIAAGILAFLTLG